MHFQGEMAHLFLSQKEALGAEVINAKKQSIRSFLKFNAKNNKYIKSIKSTKIRKLLQDFFLVG